MTKDNLIVTAMLAVCSAAYLGIGWLWSLLP